MTDHFCDEEVANDLISFADLATGSNKIWNSYKKDIQWPRSEEEDDIWKTNFNIFREHIGFYGIKALTNFSKTQFLNKWESILESVEKRLISGRESKCNI